MEMSLSKLQEMVKDREPCVLQSMGSQRVRHQTDWTAITIYLSTTSEQYFILSTELAPTWVTWINLKKGSSVYLNLMRVEFKFSHKRKKKDWQKRKEKKRKTNIQSDGRVNQVGGGTPFTWCIQISNQHNAHIKYFTILFVDYASVKLKSVKESRSLPSPTESFQDPHGTP